MDKNPKEDINKPVSRFTAVTGIGLGVFIWGLAIVALVGFAVWGVYKVLDKHGGEVAKAAPLLM